MTKPEDAEEHSEHLPCHGDGDEQKGGESRQGVEDEELADGAADREAEDVLQGLRVSGEERDGRRKLRSCGWRNRERQDG